MTTTANNSDLVRAYELADRVLAETLEILDVQNAETANVKKVDIDREVAPGHSITWSTAKTRVRVTAVCSTSTTRDGRPICYGATAQITVYEMTPDGWNQIDRRYADESGTWDDRSRKVS